MRNREEHQGKHGAYPKKLGKQEVKHEETYGEMGGMLGIAVQGISEPVSVQFSSQFIHCWIHPQMIAEFAI